MLRQALLCSVLGLVVVCSQEEDLEVVGSDNHYSYQRQYQRFNDRSQVQPPARYNSYPPRDSRRHDNADMNFPVKTVQRYTDSDGNIKVITSYSNRDENPLPVYKDANLRVFNSKKKTGYLGNYHVTHPPNVQSSSYTKLSMIPSNSLPAKQEFTRTKKIRFPENDGELFAKQHETKTRDGNSSMYNQESSYSTNYKKPELRISKGGYHRPSNINGKELTQPLQGAGSSYISDIDDEIADDGGGDYVGNGGYHTGGYLNHGYIGGVSPHIPIIPHGPIIPHRPIVPHGPHGGGFGKETGKTYSHSQHEEKGDKGGKGHKSYETYQKGHSEKHGHEENKGGHAEESGEKTGHHDEENHYVKGQSTSGGGKASEKDHVKGHKKGHKTKGFRTVHHKDEYKKDEIFYDEEHDAGNQKNQGHDQSSHKHLEGGKTKKGHLNSGYKDAQHGYHGDKEEGNSYDNSKGHEGHEGHNSHHAHHSHYSKGAGHKEGETHGHGGQGYFR